MRQQIHYKQLTTEDNLIISPRNKLVFVAVPKTGSMAMTEWLHSNFESEQTPQLLSISKFNNGHASLEDIESRGWFNFTGYTAIAVVRNPVDRFLSYCAWIDECFYSAPDDTALRRLRDVNDYTRYQYHLAARCELLDYSSWFEWLVMLKGRYNLRGVPATINASKPKPEVARTTKLAIAKRFLPDYQMIGLWELP